MKHAEERPYADPDAATRKLVEIAAATPAVQDGRIYIDRANVVLDIKFRCLIFFAPGTIPIFKIKDPTRPSGETMMLDANLASYRAHRNNIHRYRRLLETKLSDLERQYIERRLAEEQTKLDELSASIFPVVLPTRTFLGVAEIRT